MAAVFTPRHIPWVCSLASALLADLAFNAALLCRTYTSHENVADPEDVPLNNL